MGQYRTLKHKITSGWIGGPFETLRYPYFYQRHVGFIPEAVIRRWHNNLARKQTLPIASIITGWTSVSVTTSAKAMRRVANLAGACLGARLCGDGAAAEADSVARGRQAELARVFAAELRGAFIADGITHARGVLLDDEHAPRFLQSDALLVLQRAHRRRGFEVAVE